MRVSGSVACAVMISAAAPALAQGGPASATFAAEVLSALNFAREHPADYAAGLRTYRGFFHARLVVMPGQKVDLETEEGVAPVDEAIAFLERRAALAPLENGQLLADTAADLVVEQARDGATGHDGADGSPSDRAMRHGGGARVAEVIAYGPLDAADAVRQLIVDDGVADRGHRAVLFDRRLRFAGIACGPHPEYRTMCVIDLAETPDGGEARLFRTASR